MVTSALDDVVSAFEVHILVTTPHRLRHTVINGSHRSRAASACRSIFVFAGMSPTRDGLVKGYIIVLEPDVEWSIIRHYMDGMDTI
jgi:hypothetical protein